MADIDINGILNSLSGEDIEKLKGLAGGLLGGNKPTEPKSAAPEAAASPLSGIDLSSIGLPDMSALSSLAPLLSAFNKKDERSDFIMALKPLLSEERGKKADEAAKIIKLLSVLPLLKEKGIM